MPKKHHKCYCYISCCFLLGLLVFGLFIAATVCFAPSISSSQSSESKTMYAVEGDTILVDEANAKEVSGWSLKQCLKTGDYYHDITVYVVQKGDIVTHEYDDNWKSEEFHQSQPSRSTGSITSLGKYLLAGSTINYRMCIASEEALTKEGELFVFDDKDEYYSFLDGDDDKFVYHMALPIGTNNQSKCTELLYSITHSTYYFVTAKTPGRVFYQFNSSIHTLYLNFTDYPNGCYVSESNSCNVKIHETSSENNYELLAYTHPYPPHDAVPLTTHVCVDRDAKRSFPLLTIILASLFGTGFLLMSCITAICILTIFKKRRRNGYIPIDSNDTNIQGS